MTQSNRNIFVYADWLELNQPTLIGVLASSILKGKEIFAFEYDKKWLQSQQQIQLDPSLFLYTGRQYLQDNKLNFGLFMDSAPDRWGRLLMRRREAIMARQEERKVNLLFESDYLLGVYDEHRMGGLRFKMDENGPFLNDNKAMAAPPFTSLRELEHASLKIEEDKDKAIDNEYLKWLNMLMAPGSSLGGARPKASVVDPHQQLWIAKFPSRFDDKDNGAWEIVIRDLAIESGIEMSDAFIEKYGSKHHTFVTKRFDRIKEKRIHFASAMTLLNYADGVDFQDGVSYLEIAEYIMRNGSNVDADLAQLWRRIIFSICVSNTDDHLRNHGFLLTPKGWKLSPAYDLNPNEYGNGLKLNINENDNSQNIDLALEVAEHFRINSQNAKEIANHIKKICKKWSKVATKYHISRGEQEMMSRAFQQSMT